jgi:hypothetical protein
MGKDNFLKNGKPNQTLTKFEIMSKPFTHQYVLDSGTDFRHTIKIRKAKCLQMACLQITCTSVGTIKENYYTRKI